jgi:hypothetical protein
MIGQLTTSDFRAKVVELEDKLRSAPGAMMGDCFPLQHCFVDGLYVRRITMPEKTLIVSKIHAKNHPFFILKGRVSILTEDGIRHVQAPFWGITKAGTKRVLWNHEEVVWITVHRTDSTDLKEIEEQIIAKSFDDLPTLADNSNEQAQIEQFYNEMKKSG